MNNNVENKIVYLRLDDILPNRFQPREVFDETGLEELADSIKEHGVIQPIIVRQIGDKYELIAGERRSKASALAGLTTIPAIIKNMDDKESAKVSLLENLQRKNLSAIEEARTYKRIIELENLTQDDLAKTMGKSQPMIANKLRLLSLPGEVQDALIKNQISERHARSLLNVKDKNIQLKLLDKIRNERLTVRELDAEIKKLSDTNIETTQINSNPIENQNNSEMNNLNSNIQQSNPFNAQNSMNNFANTPNNDFNLNQPNAFNNMGLDDYKTSLGNNMIPGMGNNSNQNFSNMYLENENNSNSNDNFFINSIQPTPEMEYSETSQNSQQNSYSSLGSMFDGNEGSQVDQNVLNQEKNVDKNIFVSNLKENNRINSENRFLPNFNNNQVQKIDFSNGYMDSNNDNFQNINDQSFRNPNEFVDFSQGLSTDNATTSFDNFNSMQPISSINEEPNYNRSVNQGELFNQPLNIVNVPNNQNEVAEENTNFEEQKEEKFDNPFNDQYENILFAKPVSIEAKTDNPTNEVNQSNLEATNNDISQEDNKTNYDVENITTNNQESNVQDQYISLEPTRTIFDTRGAVLELKRTTDRIKAEGIDMESEEINYDDYYQIIIKIKK